MRQIKRLKAFVCALAGTALLSACSSEADEIINEAGKGYVSLSVQADAGFQTTRAINDADYTNLENYTVQILNGDKVVDNCEWKGDALPTELVELDNGSYTLLAFTGEEYKDEGATTEGMYVAGSLSFNMNGENKEIAVTCTPQCARAKVIFDEQMAEYFKDYYVVFSGTKALGSKTFTWGKDSTDPVYMAIDGTETVTATIKLVDKEGKVADDIVKTYSLSPAKAISMSIAPAVESGNVGISIKIDTTTNDKPIDIEIPIEWI